MASPQIENGFTMLANELLEALMRTNFSSYQIRILFAIWRRTYAWKKKDDWISNGQLTEMTGIRKQHISRTVKELRTRNIVTKAGYKIAFNKDYSQWRELPKQVTVTNPGKKVTSSGFKSNLIRGTQKNKYKQKNIPPKIFDLAAFLAECILKNNHKHSKLTNGAYQKTVRKWAEDIDKLYRLDKQSVEDIRVVIEWSQADNFWRKNILSGTALRKNWDRLYMAAMEQMPKEPVACPEEQAKIDAINTKLNDPVSGWNAQAERMWTGESETEGAYAG